jgi:Chaperone of endosialidase
MRERNQMKMKGNKHMKTTTNIIYPAFALFAMACFALSPTAQAVSPPPDGGYPGHNTAEGKNALFSLTTGSDNTAAGFQALGSNTTGSSNTAAGSQALRSNTTGFSNTANGAFTLFSNTGGSDEEGSFNTATGFQALFSNTTGHRNTATGRDALFSNTIGIRNTACGNSALFSNTNSNFNTAVGDNALLNLTTANPNEGANTAIGAFALVNSTTGEANTAIGESALVNHITGNQNIVLGYAAGQDLTDGGVNIYISNPGVSSESNSIRIGNVVTWTDIYGFGHPAHTATYIAGISGQTAAAGVAVYVNTDGKLGTLTSSARFKTEIKPMDKASEAILALNPVTFRYKKEVDPEGIPQFGLVAEEVEKVNPDLVARDAGGKAYTVRYEAVNAMLLNEFLKAHRKIEEQGAIIAQQRRDFEAAIAQQKQEIQTLTASLKEQASQIQKVSARVDLQRTAAQTIAIRAANPVVKGRP